MNGNDNERQQTVGAAAGLWTEHSVSDPEGLPISSLLYALWPGLQLIPCGDEPSIFRLRAVGPYEDLRPVLNKLGEVGGDWDSLEGPDRAEE